MSLLYYFHICWSINTTQIWTVSCLFDYKCNLGKLNLKIIIIICIYIAPFPSQYKINTLLCVLTCAPELFYIMIHTVKCRLVVCAPENLQASIHCGWIVTHFSGFHTKADLVLHLSSTVTTILTICFLLNRNLVTCLSVSMDGTVLLSGSNDETVRMWDVQSKQCIRSITHKGEHLSPSFPLSLSPCLIPSCTG